MEKQDDPTDDGGDDEAGALAEDAEEEVQHFHRLRRFVHPAEQKSIAPVLALTLLAMLMSPILGDGDWSRAVEVALVGASVVVALIRTGAHPVIRRVGVSVVVLATIVAATIPVINSGMSGWLAVLAAGLFAVLLLITPVLVMIRLMLRPKITIDTLAGALTAYLQIGIFFGAFYLFIALIDGPSAFFAQSTAPAYSDFQYFSFITMTTVGYGDLTPATHFGQTMATFEAVIGQVFLVTVVALTVSNLGRPTHRVHSGDS